MSHIEEKLDLYQTRYVNFLDRLSVTKSEIPMDSLPESQLKELRARLSGHYHKGPRELLKIAPEVNLVVWAAYILYLLIIN